jgi:hypothetical protein
MHQKPFPEEQEQKVKEERWDTQANHEYDKATEKVIQALHIIF